MPIPKKKSVKKSNMSEGTIVHRHIHSKMMSNFSLQFSLYFRKKTFWWAEKKTRRSYHLFFFLPTQPNTLQKSFPSNFLFKIFHPPYKFICMWVFLILLVCITFCYNTICVNNDVIGCLCVPYKYNITLYNLIIRK